MPYQLSLLGPDAAEVQARSAITIYNMPMVNGDSLLSASDEK